MVIPPLERRPVSAFDRMPTNAESEARDNALNTYLATTDRAMQASSGERAKYRHRVGSILLQEQVWRNRWGAALHRSPLRPMER